MCSLPIGTIKVGIIIAIYIYIYLKKFNNTLNIINKYVDLQTRIKCTFFNDYRDYS